MKKIITDSPLGKLVIVEEEGMITEIYATAKEHFISETPLLLDAKRQLEEYFQKQRKTFDLPLFPKGTPYQKQVWQELLKIPYGKVATYGEIAKRIGNPLGARSVGGACNKNPIMVVIPCHRVIGKTGNLTGYAEGLDKKELLLKLESDL
ncbi:MAG TPA: methylated-DNA--[protein]-cysteine S-methyltransferase [Acholeplasmataceae bacterium]|jgi:methylated-DNA-[protein]-cysteine S-methyltransferase|nr:methylated-DNA--[protein]-cysteine S-methyltransferase [Acholeplasmataceae bacterium]